MRLQPGEPIVIERDCIGVIIPDGTRTTLKSGALVTLQQALGGDYTVRSGCGDLVRISGEDGDALGMEPAAPRAAHLPGAPFDEENIWDELRTVYDPEIPVNVVELGLIYECTTETLDDGSHRVDIVMTLTAPGCGMGEVLKQDVERKILSVSGVRICNVELVFDPIWGPERMSEAARLHLGFF